MVVPQAKSKRNRKLKLIDNSQSQVGSGANSFMKSELNTSRLWKSRQLEVVLYKYTSNIINTGELDPRLPELGVILTKVSMAPGLDTATLQWEAAGTQNDIEVGEILSENAKRLRHLLMSMGVMGQVPVIRFAKDDRSSKLRVVEELFKVADMGPDFAATTLGEDMKSTPEVSLEYFKRETVNNVDTKCHQIEPEGHQQVIEHHGVKEIISKSWRKQNTSEVSPGETDISVTEKIQNQWSDIYGLDRTAIMQRISHTKNKARSRTCIAELVDEVTANKMFTPKNVKRFMKRNKELKVSKKPVMPKTYINDDEENYSAGMDNNVYYHDSEMEPDDYVAPEMFDENKIK